MSRIATIQPDLRYPATLPYNPNMLFVLEMYKDRYEPLLGAVGRPEEEEVQEVQGPGRAQPCQ